MLDTEGVVVAAAVTDTELGVLLTEIDAPLDGWNVKLVGTKVMVAELEPIATTVVDSAVLDVLVGTKVIVAELEPRATTVVD